MAIKEREVGDGEIRDESAPSTYLGGLLGHGHDVDRAGGEESGRHFKRV